MLQNKELHGELPFIVLVRGEIKCDNTMQRPYLFMNILDGFFSHSPLSLVCTSTRPDDTFFFEHC